jgi:hypothetical protein
LFHQPGRHPRVFLGPDVDIVGCTSTARHDYASILSFLSSDGRKQGSVGVVVEGEEQRKFEGLRLATLLLQIMPASFDMFVASKDAFPLLEPW